MLYGFKSASLSGTLSVVYIYITFMCVYFYKSYKLYLFLITTFIYFYTQNSFLS